MFLSPNSVLENGGPSVDGIVCYIASADLPPSTEDGGSARTGLAAGKKTWSKEGRQRWPGSHIAGSEESSIKLIQLISSESCARIAFDLVLESRQIIAAIVPEFHITTLPRVSLASPSTCCSYYDFVFLSYAMSVSGCHYLP